MQHHLLKISRLEGLTDGVFAIAMTILALDLRLPRGLDSTHLLITLQSDVAFKLYIYIVSFIILGTLWVAMSFQIGLLERVNRPYLWTHVFYLMAVCIVPFSASLVAAYPQNPASISFYAYNLIAASLCQFLICECARSFNLNNSFYTQAIRRAIVRRIFVAPAFYVVALVLVHWDTKLAFVLLLAPTVLYMIPGRVDQYESVSPKK